MSKTEWLVLFLLFIAYLFLGASIFYKIERDLEEEKRGQAEADQKYLRGFAIAMVISTPRVLAFVKKSPFVSMLGSNSVALHSGTFPYRDDSIEIMNDGVSLKFDPFFKKGDDSKWME